MKIAYLVHDLNDPAVARRIRMFHAGGASVEVLGFHRLAQAPATVEGAPARSLGRTVNAAFVQRCIAVARSAVMPGALRAAVRDADVIVARNLETLALAARVTPAGTRLVYECLDIHRLLLGDSLPSRLLQRLEAALLRRIDLLLVSSPFFLSEHFVARRDYRGPALLVENKVLALGERVPGQVPVPATPPWRIGWFGNIRCGESLRILREAVRRADGRIEVVVAGRPSHDQFEDFDRDVSNLPGIRFLGAFRQDELPRLYADIHFAWAVDFFEEGLNSTWLLPNRLYDSVAFGAVPIALGSVATGAWLKERGVGLVLDDVRADLGPRLAALTAPEVEQMRAAVLAVPRDEVVAGERECRDLVQAIAGEPTRL